MNNHASSHSDGSAIGWGVTPAASPKDPTFYSVASADVYRKFWKVHGRAPVTSVKSEQAGVGWSRSGKSSKCTAVHFMVHARADLVCNRARSGALPVLPS